MIFEAKMEISAQDVIELGSKVTDIIHFFDELEKKKGSANWVVVDAQTSKCERCGHIAKTAEERSYFCPDCGSAMRNLRL